MSKSDKTGEVHNLINRERKKRRLPHIYWSREMQRLAKDQANYCARVGRLVHSDRFAFQGGENLCGGKGNLSARSIVDTWMRSKAGHREYLLSSEVRKAAVAITSSGYGTYAAWAFSSQSPDPSDCPYYKSRVKPLHLRFPHLKIMRRRKIMLRMPVGLFLGFIGVFGFVLGAHGIYAWVHRNDWQLAMEVVGGSVKQGDLFFMFSIPIIDKVVSWMSYEGVHSLLIPLAVVIASFLLWRYRNWIAEKL